VEKCASFFAIVLEAIPVGGVEVWRGGLGWAYRLPTLSSVGASREENKRRNGFKTSQRIYAVGKAVLIFGLLQGSAL
jgi:hypothetical protein